VHLLIVEDDPRLGRTSSEDAGGATDESTRDGDHLCDRSDDAEDSDDASS
jgi:hypothetical protein